MSNSKAREDFEDSLVKQEKLSTRQQDIALAKIRGMIKSGHDGSINLQYQAKKDWKDCATRRTPSSSKMERLN